MNTRSSRSKEQDRGRPGLLDMPDVVLVEILQYLDLPCRFHVSCTCRRLQTLFHHPQVWRHVSVRIVGYVSEPTSFARKQSMPMMSSGVFALYVNLFLRFGHCVHSLTFTFLTGCDRLAPYWQQLMNLVMKKCSPVLQNLALLAGTFVSDGYPNDVLTRRYRVQRKYLASFIKLVQSSRQLRSLNISYWPVPDPRRSSGGDASRTDGLCVFEAVLNSHLELAHLQIYAEAKQRSYYRPCQHVGTELVVRLLQKFKNLRSLALQHDLVDKQVLLELANSERPTDLRELRIPFHRNWVCNVDDQKVDLENVEDDVWMKVVTQNPQLRSKLRFGYAYPVAAVWKTLKPSIPLVDLELSCFLVKSKDHEELLPHVADMYQNSLERLTWSSPLIALTSSRLVPLVRKCQRLTTLRILDQAQIHYRVVLDVAAERRSSWRCLQFPLSISFTEESCPQTPTSSVEANSTLCSQSRDGATPAQGSKPRCSASETGPEETKNVSDKRFARGRDEELAHAPSCSTSSMSEHAGMKRPGVVKGRDSNPASSETEASPISNSSSSEPPNTGAGSGNRRRKKAKTTRQICRRGSPAAETPGVSVDGGQADHGDDGSEGLGTERPRAEQASVEASCTGAVLGLQQGLDPGFRATVSSAKDLERAVSDILGYTWTLPSA